MMDVLIEKPLTTSRTHHGLWEYLLVAQPDKAVQEKVTKEKETFAKNHNYVAAVTTQPHITVANFLAKEPMEETLIRWMQNIFKTQKSFAVTLTNFSGCAPHSIFIQVADAAPFQQLAKSLQALDGFIQASNCPPLYTVYHPHLTIARKLTPQVYHNAMQQYAGRCFQASFIASELVLLKRQSQYDKCAVTNVFKLPPYGSNLFN